MANILITHFSPFYVKGEFKSFVFFDGLIKGFTDEGHNVLQIITSDFLNSPWNGCNEPFSASIKTELLEKIKSFSPDLVISFNNSSIADIEKTIDCPIALWDADTFQFFNDKEKIINNADRYHYMAFFEYGIKDYELNLSVNRNRICRVPGATAIEAHDEVKQYNISFIGKPFIKPDNLIALLNQHPELIRLDHESIENIDQNTEELLKKFRVKKHELKHHWTADRRAQLIMQLLPLKPKIFGPSEWLKLGCSSSELIEAYDPRVAYSLLHNEKIYNRSKVSISSNHTQNTLGYPWRIHDIMGSASALLSEKRKELVDDFAHMVNIQLFDSPAEASETAKKLINDEPLRASIVAQQQEAINKYFRWKNRLPLIQELTGVSLEGISGQKGTHELFRPSIRLPIAKKRPVLKRIKKCIKKELFKKTNSKEISMIEYS